MHRYKVGRFVKPEQIPATWRTSSYSGSSASSECVEVAPLVDTATVLTDEWAPILRAAPRHLLRTQRRDHRGGPGRCPRGPKAARIGRLRAAVHRGRWSGGA
ncbi:DUF397 domain-containing protein [Embleya sp. NPDC020886]|uniref:DUF397 domain-containing protein n=1 Tax=Embleya sp. NPDC020886 TaxID=3363980 RepID=UPI0037B7F6EE